MKGVDRILPSKPVKRLFELMTTHAPEPFSLFGKKKHKWGFYFLQDPTYQQLKGFTFSSVDQCHFFYTTHGKCQTSHTEDYQCESTQPVKIFA